MASARAVEKLAGDLSGIAREPRLLANGARHAIGVIRLEAFLTDNSIKPLTLAYEAGMSRQHLYRMRIGRSSPTVRMAVRLRDACERLLSRPVKLSELFEGL